MRLFALLLLAGLPAVALDPRFVWETLDTPHFEVHYHQGTYRYAQRVARAAELSYQRLVPLLDHVPDGRTHIVVQDDTDFANGSASPILYNLIHAYAPPPDARSTLADFDDNVYELISHEYTHILHLDTVLGLPQAVNDVFGKLWITNGGQPIWFIEGMATFAESEVSAAGRVRASEEDMVVRAEVLEGRLPRIDTLSNLPLDWPRGFGQYTVGSRFLSFIGSEYGLVANLWSDGSGDSGLAVGPDGRIVYARAEVFQEFEILQDLFSVDPQTGDERRLSRGLRARAPDVSRDGGIAFVWRRSGGRTAIAELRPEGPRVLFEDPHAEPVDSPRYSPDGARVAFLHHRDGAWDVRIVDRASLAVTDVTRDRALDRDPAWTRDGRWLLFSSDRNGVYNLYAWRPGDLRQVTNVVLGAFEPDPSPDGTQLALVTYSSRGYDVGRIALDPDSWRPVTAPPVAEQRPPVTAVPQEEIYPTRPYSAWETLRPHFWLPYAAADGYGTTLGVLTAGFDAIERHEYAATAWWSLTGKEPGWDLIYVNHSFYPDLTLELTRDLGVPQAAGGLDALGYYYERFVGGSISASFPFSQVERAQSLALTY